MEMRVDVLKSRDLTAAMRMFICVAALLGISLCSGCLHKKPMMAKKPAATAAAPVSTATNAPASDHDLIVTPATGLSGKVALVNVDARFVVLNFPVGQMPVVGQRLHVYRNGLKVGELSVTGPQKDDNTVADITAGDAAKGDEVRDR